MAVAKRRAVKRLPISQVGLQIRNVVRQVNRNKECIVIEKDGVPVAGVVGLADLDDLLEIRDEKLNAQIAQGWREYKSGKLRKTGREFLAELASEIQSEKRKRITA